MRPSEKFRRAVRAAWYDAMRALPHFPWPWLLPWAVTLVVAQFVETAGLVAVAFLGTLAVVGWWLVREVAPAQTSKGVMRRRDDRRQRADGTASLWDVAERASRKALRLQAYVMRPSLRGVRRGRIRPTQLGFLIAKTGSWWTPRMFRELWSGYRDTTLVVGPPGANKTITLATFGLDAPGALLTTSTKPDLAENVQQARMGRPVHVFNPTQIGTAPNTVRWSIRSGCEDYMVAMRRAASMIPTSKSPEQETWDMKARNLLTLLLHASVLARVNEVGITKWLRQISQPTRGDGSNPALSEAMNEIEAALDTAWGADEKIETFRAICATPDRFRGSVIGMAQQALAWLADETALSIGAAQLEDINFDPALFILDRETLHIIGPDQVGGAISPLTSALVDEVAEQARRLASARPGGRLDPPLTMLIDEAAVAVRLPLDNWSADMGGRGIVLFISVQSLSQLEQVWGRAGAGTLKGNVNNLVIFGGGKDADELDAVSQLCGQHLMDVVSPQLKGAAGMKGIQRGEQRWVENVSVADLANMAPGHVVVLRRGLGGVYMGTTPTVLDRRGWQSVSLVAPVTAPRVSVEHVEDVDVTAPLPQLESSEEVGS